MHMADAILTYVNDCVFFFKQKTAYEMRISDWSSDVCSSDLQAIGSIGGATTAECQPYFEGLPTNLPWQLPTEGLPRQTLCQAVLKCLFAYTLLLLPQQQRPEPTGQRLLIIGHEICIPPHPVCKSAGPPLPVETPPALIA